jgi:hypothetical protein
LREELHEDEMILDQSALATCHASPRPHGERASQGTLTLVPAIYALETGKVEFWDLPWGGIAASTTLPGHGRDPGRGLIRYPVQDNPRHQVFRIVQAAALPPVRRRFTRARSARFSRVRRPDRSWTGAC